MRRTSVVALAVATTLVPAASAEAALTVRGSVNQVQVTGAKPGSRLVLLRHGRRVASQRAGKLGGAVFRSVKAGRGYALRSRHFTVLSTKPPSRKLFKQRIPKSGYGYLRTRDGTKLAIDVHLPSGPGPYPTLVEYSGYDYANPAGAESSIGPIATLLGYAVVDVNMRGTGCSGGAFDFFEPLQGLDGYDVIETVARKPWVLHHKVGMLGVSYGGISQMFVAATRPPSLAAITPLSLIDNAQTTLYPGGILNTGFTLTWAKDRVHDAKPATATGGQKWALDRIKAGDRTCKANQVLHAEAVDLLAKVRANNYYVRKVADPLSPVTFVHKIKAAVFLACQFTDEQTGGHCPTLAERFTGTRRKWFTFTNGTHVDSLDPATFNRWYDFLELYVARRAPKLPDGVKAVAPAILESEMGVKGVTLPDDPIQRQPSYAAAKAAFVALPPMRILFDNGAGGAAGAPVPGFEQSFARFPLPGTHARSWYLAANGTLSDAAPPTGTDAFTWNQRARPATDFTGDTGAGGLWTATPNYAWAPNPAGTALSYVSAPLTASTVVVGAGALQAWVRSAARDVDLQATVSEVRPDGKETFVQSGWLRASVRKLRKGSSLLAPELSLRRRDAAPLPKGRDAQLVIPLYYQGHAYRAGSRIRVTLSAPGGDQPIWAFADTRPKGTAQVSVTRGKSRLVLPVVDGIAVPTGLPPCPGLRGEPCRTYTGG
ncbi:MAG TPA: CocE/NonD family hydrolase [Solirubrobacteraceae bacterium]